MALRQIRYDGDEILRKKSKIVKEMNDRIDTLIDDMLETMYEANGVGLAAPQVGILKRIVVIDVEYSEEEDSSIVMINPEILEKEGEQTGDEGCLSLPGLVAEVTRPNYVKCRFFNEEFEECEIEAEGLLARAICHEVDHLEGILYKDVANEPLRSVEYHTDEEEDSI